MLVRIKFMSNSDAWKEGVEGSGKVKEEDEVISIYAYHFSSFIEAFFGSRKAHMWKYMEKLGLRLIIV